MSEEKVKTLKLGHSEHTIQNWILDCLGTQLHEAKRDKNGAYRKQPMNVYVHPDNHSVWYRNNTGAMMSVSGTWVKYGLGTGGADIIGVVNGRAVALEVKADSGRQTGYQKVWQSHWQGAGGIYVVVRSAREAVQVVERLLAGANDNHNIA